MGYFHALFGNLLFHLTFSVEVDILAVVAAGILLAAGIDTAPAVDTDTVAADTLAAGIDTVPAADT